METDTSNDIVSDNYSKLQDNNIQEPSILLLSSLVFVTNIITAYINEQYVYSFLFCILTITSLIVHYKNNYYTNIIDKIAILSIVLYGGYMLCNKINTNEWCKCFVIIVAFLLCIYICIFTVLLSKSIVSVTKNVFLKSIILLCIL
jgi:hypothetical protein